jgi:hypothetical protein
MKPVGIIVGVLVLLIGLLVSYNALTSTYSKSICESAMRDKQLADEASKYRGSGSAVLEEKYKEAKRNADAGELSCDRAKSGERNQLIIGVVVTILGALFALVGFIIGRKKATT